MEKMKNPKDAGVYNVEKMRIYNIEKKCFDNIKSLSLSEETFAKFNSIIEKEQEKTEMNRRSRNKGITKISNDFMKKKEQQKKKKKTRKEKKIKSRRTKKEKK